MRHVVTSLPRRHVVSLPCRSGVHHSVATVSSILCCRHVSTSLRARPSRQRIVTVESSTPSSPIAPSVDTPDGHIPVLCAQVIDALLPPLQRPHHDIDESNKHGNKSKRTTRTKKSPVPPTSTPTPARRIFIDGTLGAGGHSSALLRTLQRNGNSSNSNNISDMANGIHLIGMDRDVTALDMASQRLQNLASLCTPVANVSLYNSNYANIRHVLQHATTPSTPTTTNGVRKRGRPKKDSPGVVSIQQVDAMLFDLGVSSMQIDQAPRGFAFMKEGPLDMRMAQPPTSVSTDASSSSGLRYPTMSSRIPLVASDTFPFAPISNGPPIAGRMDPLSVIIPDNFNGNALNLIDTLTESQLADVIYAFGEDRLSRRIAADIKVARLHDMLRTTADLAGICRNAYGVAASGHRKAARQRGEEVRGIGEDKGVHPATKTFQALRMAVNDELRSLSQLLQQIPTLLASGGRVAIISFHSLEDRLVKHTFRLWHDEGLGHLVERRAMVASDLEVKTNPRSRSAKLRVFEKA
jgi:16S rRNA C1402 N4-methylase RsmH